MKTKKEYEAPDLTVVTVKSELGYAASNGFLSIFRQNSDPAFNDEGQENWNDGGSLFGDSWD